MVSIPQLMQFPDLRAVVGLHDVHLLRVPFLIELCLEIIGIVRQYPSLGKEAVVFL
jgi:hypothetical protein